ncbi:MULTISPECIES: MFS transporter [Xanthomonas]|uniref:MFS transporter n=1 Tax=Xanthomonas TaxID=338 RepID=UPI0009B798A6|nr:MULTISPECIES: MFS transporter [Xanthomonas]QTK37172.1 MFS transporter [Xanthomonas citri pv. glycines]QWN16414.1 MFS transporter [Xanthomonas citri]WDJ87976.1 MFS transporter [Xanthomonas campestris]
MNLSITAKQRSVAMMAILLGVAMAILDASMIAVALPRIAHQLEISASNSIFIVSAYQIAMVASLLIFSALGDIIGHKSIYILGVVAFSLSSLGCAITSSFELLVLLRCAQGLGGSALAGVNIAIIRNIYPPHLFGRGIGTSALVVALSFCAGPLLASLILTFTSWKVIFFLNFILSIAVFLFSILFIPNDSKKLRVKIPWWDFSVVFFSFLLLSSSLAMVGTAGHGQARIKLSGLTFIIGFLLLAYSPRSVLKFLPAPSNRGAFITATLITFFGYISQGAALISLPFFFFVEHIAGLGTSVKVMFFWSLLSGLFAYLAGLWSDKIEPTYLLVTGLFFMLTGVTFLGILNIKTPWFAPLFAALAGAGFGMFQTPNLRLLLSFSASKESGRANGVLATLRLLGQMIGGVVTAVFLGLDPMNGARWSLIASAFSVLISFGLSILLAKNALK